jgi:hypothetical protein
MESEGNILKIKKSISRLLALILVTIPLCDATVFAFTGTASDPFPIRNMIDLQRTAECIRINKNWSNGKHFSLQTSIELTEPITLANNSSETHQFNGIFHGNGHTITLTGGYSLFGYIGKGGLVENLTIAGKGDFAAQNHGVIKDCASTADAYCGITSQNNGTIQSCLLKGKYGTTGVTNNNYGGITKGVVDGSVIGYWAVGLVSLNDGEITHCRVKALVKNSGNGHDRSAGLAIQNRRTIANCTMDGILEGADTVFLIYGFHGKDAAVRKCVAGKNSRGAIEDRLFAGQCENMDNMSECGYGDWDVPDFCQTIPLELLVAKKMIEVVQAAAPGAKTTSEAIVSARNGVIVSVVEGFFKAPIDLLERISPPSVWKDMLGGLSSKLGDITQYFEDTSPDPKVFKVAKIGGDIVGVVIGFKGTVTAISKAGEIIKAGKAAQGLSYMIGGGGGVALATDAVFVTDECLALAGVAGAKAASSSLLMIDRGKSAAEGMLGSGSGSGSGGGSGSGSSSSTNRMIGEKGTRVDSHKVWQEGPTERVEVENPAPGRIEGKVHYHEANNTKWKYDIDRKVFLDKDGVTLAPPRIQKLLQETHIQKAIEKALYYLGEGVM